jgi:hypothetical protein
MKIVGAFLASPLLENGDDTDRDMKTRFAIYLLALLHRPIDLLDQKDESFL